MKQITRMASLAVLLLAGVSGSALANGTEVPPPPPPAYVPPPPPAYKPPPPPPPVAKHDENGPYVSLSGGLSLLNNSKVDGRTDAATYKTGYLVNGAVGLKNDNVRVEAEVGYHRNSVDKAWDGTAMQSVTNANISMWTFMANAYYDFDMNGSDINPFIMGGLGIARASLNYGDGTSDHSSQFAWQLGAGIGIKASKNVTVDIGYRYLKPSEADFGGSKATLGGSEILAGIRVGI